MKTFLVVTVLIALLSACGTTSHAPVTVGAISSKISAQECGKPDKFTYTLQAVRCKPGWVLNNPAYGANSQIGAEQ